MFLSNSPAFPLKMQLLKSKPQEAENTPKYPHESITSLVPAPFSPILPWAQPQVIGRDIARTLRPTIEFMTMDMGRSLEEINRNPVSLLCSLENRIKPRYRYMMAHRRRKDCGLGTLCTLPDERFAWLVAKQPTQHYIEWRKSSHLWLCNRSYKLPNQVSDPFYLFHHQTQDPYTPPLNRMLNMVWR